MASMLAQWRKKKGPTRLSGHANGYVTEHESRNGASRRHMADGVDGTDLIPRPE